jgi:hypothetical protein
VERRAPGGGIPGPLGTGVHALASFAGKLYVGGNFAQTGSGSAARIASWDGASWSPLTTGIPDWDISSRVASLGVHDGKLYVGGNFISAGGVTSRALAGWDGAQWSSVGGISGPDQAQALRCSSILQETALGSAASSSRRAAGPRSASLDGHSATPSSASCSASGT